MPQGLTFNVYGHDVSAGKTLKGVEQQADKSSHHISGAFTKVGSIIGGEVGAAIDETGQKLSELGGHGVTAKISGIGVAAAGLGGVLTAMGDKEKAATQQLDQAITNSGHSVEEYDKGIEDTVSHMERFGHSAVETKGALQILTNATHDPAQGMKLMGEVADLAAAKHISLSSASEQVAKVLSGHGARALAAYNLQVVKNADGTTNWTATNQKLADVLKGQASAASDTLTGHLKALRTEVEDNVAEFGQKYGPAILVAGTAMSTVKPVVQGLKGAASGLGTMLKNLKGAGEAGAEGTKSFGKGSAAAGVALVGLGVVITGVMMKEHEHAQQMAINKQATDAYTAAIQADNGALGANVRAQVAKNLSDQDAYQIASKMGISQRTLTDAVMGNVPALEQVQAAAKDYAKQGGDAAGAALRLSAAVGGNVDVLGKAKTQSKDLAAATDTNSTAQDASTQSIKKATAALDDQKAAADQLLASIDKLSGNAISAEQAELRFRDGVAQATQQVKDNGSSLSANTTKGRSNREWLLDQISSLRDVASAQLTAGESTATVTAKLQKNETQLRNAAIAAGMNKDEVNALVRAFGKLPVKKAVPISLPGIQQSIEALAILRAGLSDPTLGASVSATGVTHLKGGGGYAQGTGFSAGGEMTVGELGKERITLPPGSQVTSATATASQDRMRNGTREKATVVHNYNTVTINQYGMPGGGSIALPAALRDASANLGSRG